MLHALVFLGWLFSRPPLIGKSALPDGDARAAFEITRQVIRTQTRQEMVKLCDAGSDIRGCTRFVGESVAPEYTSSEAGEWRMKLKAHIQALIIFNDPEVMGHELRHIADMQAAVGELLQRVAERSYPSRAACAAAANATIASFHHDLAVLAARSNAKLQ